MKKWILLLIACSLSLYADSSEEQEVAALDLTQMPISLEEIQLPTPSIVPPHKNSFLAVSLSSLFPGLGHVYLQEGKTASGLMGSAGLGFGLVLYPDSPLSARVAGSLTIQTSWLYGLYAAYRDVRLYNGTSGYSYKMPTDTFTDLTLAPFSWSVLKKPEVWGALLGKLVLATTVLYFAYPREAHIQPPSFSIGEELASPLIAFPVGIGEEAFFRGFLQSGLSEMLTPWGGIALSSLLFGAAHIPNALFLPPEDQWRYLAFSLPMITLGGAYCGWLTYKNRSLRQSVALHVWYDFALMAASALATQVASTSKNKGFAFSIPF